MKPSEFRRLLLTLIPAHEPVLIVGPPGCAKTSVGVQVTEELGWRMVIMHPVVSDPTDFKGMPYVGVNGVADFIPFGDLRAILETTEPTVVFFDDIGQAPQTVQAALMQLILARRIGEHKIPDCVTFIAATNRRQDRAGVTGILKPVKSRFATIIELTVDLDDWTQWALDHEMPVELIAFLRLRPELLHDFKPTADLVNSPCPRTWANAGRLINLGCTSLETLSGAVGEGAATELVAFLRTFRQLPDIDAILRDPQGQPVPEEPSAILAVTAALVRRSVEFNAPAAIAYLSRCAKEFGEYGVKAIVRRWPSVVDTREYIGFSAAA